MESPIAPQFLDSLEQAGAAGLSLSKLIGPGKKGKEERQAAVLALATEGRILNIGTDKKPTYILPKFKKDPAEELIAKLDAAGSAGLNKKALGLAKAGPEQEALARLLDEGKAVNIGTAKNPLYVLAQHYEPLEIAYSSVESKALPGTPRLFARKDLAKGCTGPALEKLDEAIALLVQEKKLVRIQHGKTILFLHAAGVIPHLHFPALADGKPAVVAAERSTETSVPVEKLRETYQEIVRDGGFSDVLISDLQKRSGVPLTALKPWLREESRAGRVLPTRGDWSLADADSRMAALEIAGEPHLRVRLL